MVLWGIKPGLLLCKQYASMCSFYQFQRNARATQIQYSLHDILCSRVNEDYPKATLQLLKLNPNLTPYSRKVENWYKSDNVINAGPIYVRKRWSGSVTGVAWHGCSRDRGARGPRFDSRGNRPFMGCHLKMRLHRKDSKPGLGFN